jgi:hypothetical protein
MSWSQSDIDKLKLPKEQRPEPKKKRAKDKQTRNNPNQLKPDLKMRTEIIGKEINYYFE